MQFSLHSAVSEEEQERGIKEETQKLISCTFEQESSFLTSEVWD